MNVLFYIQGDVIITAYYLVNHMPCIALHSKIPYATLFSNGTLYSLPLCVFGCTCFVCKFSSRVDKLGPIVEKFVFLGYSYTERDYCCYSPSLQNFNSADITFHVSVPYFFSTLCVSTHL